MSEGVSEENTIYVSFEGPENKSLRDPLEFVRFVRENISGKGECYVLLDEVQMVDDFEGVMNTLIKDRNLDVYVIGSNSRFLSSDIRSSFRGRGDIVRMYPLSFSEFSSVYSGRDAWAEYARFGGMPSILGLRTPEQKVGYLNDLMEHVYTTDIIGRYGIRRLDGLSMTIGLLSSSVGSFINLSKLADRLHSVYHSAISEETVGRYLDILEETFLFERSRRYDIKNRRYIGSLMKCYVADIGLMNARLGFRETDMSSIMENVIYNELRSRGYEVDVGVVDTRHNTGGRRTVVRLVVDFVANKGDKRYYVQSAHVIPDEAIRKQETRVFSKIGDSFKKVLVIEDDIYPYTDNQGVLNIGIRQFLLDENSLDL